jgi:hypothetical protein
MCFFIFLEVNKISQGIVIYTTREEGKAFVDESDFSLECCIWFRSIPDIPP